MLIVGVYEEIYWVQAFSSKSNSPLHVQVSKQVGYVFGPTYAILQDHEQDKR